MPEALCSEEEEGARWHAQIGIDGSLTVIKFTTLICL